MGSHIWVGGVSQVGGWSNVVGVGGVTGGEEGGSHMWVGGVSGGWVE